MIDFCGKRKLWFSISIGLILFSMAIALFFGVELDINFRGGSIVTYSFSGEVPKEAFESTVEEILGQKVSLQEQKDIATDAMNYVVTLSAKSGIAPEKQIEITTGLQKAFADNNIQVVSLSNVDPSIGREFFVKSMVALLAASVLMIIYIGFRFRKMGGWSAGVMAVVALMHDIMIVFATFVIFRIPLDDNFIAVSLTILGYSLNDTIIIYDRIRENKRLRVCKTIDELVNKSINQSLTRSLNTSIATVLSMVVVCIMALVYNVDSILTFAFPMTLGMISGSYSSICIAGPLWAMWQNHKAEKKKI
ncbi:protein translocase subunit SecF [Oscillospiraceae bacterium PP1C4]